MKSAPLSAHNELRLSACERLLGGELAAVAVYDRVIRAYEDGPAIGVLRQVRDEHDGAAALLRGHLDEGGGGTVIGSGGTIWDEAAEDLADLAGGASLAKTLQEKEERWRAAYRGALKEEALPPACKELIRFELLPRAGENIDSLQSLSSLTPEGCGGGRFPFVPQWL